MPRPRFHDLPVERRRHILDLAATHFARDGFDGASLNRILADAEISKGVAYYYFDDKGDLFATVVEEAWDELERELWPDGFDPARLRGEALWPELESIYVRQVVGLARRPDTWRVVKATRAAAADPSVARLLPRIEALLGGLHALLAQAQRDGQVRDDLPSELLVAAIGALDDAIDDWITRHPGEVDAALARRTFSLLRDALTPRSR